MHKAVTAPYPEPPKRLTSDPASSGLILVQAELHGAFLSEFDLIGVTLERQGGSPETIRMGNIYQGLFGGLGGPVLFEVAPGRYRIVQLKGQNVNGWKLVRLPLAPQYEAEVHAGALVYIGTVHTRSKGRGQVTAELTYDAASEVKGWQRVIKEYPTSVWVSIIEDRIRAASQ